MQVIGDSKPAPPDLLSIYRQGQELLKAGKLEPAAGSWRAAAGQIDHSAPAWSRLWLPSRVADAFAGERQWKDADAAYQSVIGESAGVDPDITTELLKAWAGTFAQRGDWANAEKYYRQAAIESQKLRSENLLLANIFDLIAFASSTRGDASQAEKYNFAALAIQQSWRRRAWLPLSPSTASV